MPSFDLLSPSQLDQNIRNLLKVLDQLSEDAKKAEATKDEKRVAEMNQVEIAKIRALGEELSNVFNLKLGISNTKMGSRLAHLNAQILVKKAETSYLLTTDSTPTADTKEVAEAKAALAKLIKERNTMQTRHGFLLSKLDRLTTSTVLSDQDIAQRLTGELLKIHSRLQQQYKSFFGTLDVEQANKNKFYSSIYGVIGLTDADANGLSLGDEANINASIKQLKAELAQNKKQHDDIIRQVKVASRVASLVKKFAEGSLSAVETKELSDAMQQISASRKPDADLKVRELDRLDAEMKKNQAARVKLVQQLATMSQLKDCLAAATLHQTKEEKTRLQRYLDKNLDYLDFSMRPTDAQLGRFVKVTSTTTTDQVVYRNLAKGSLAKRIAANDERKDYPVVAKQAAEIGRNFVKSTKADAAKRMADAAKKAESEGKVVTAKWDATNPLLELSISTIEKKPESAGFFSRIYASKPKPSLNSQFRYTAEVKAEAEIKAAEEAAKATAPASEVAAEAVAAPTSPRL